MRQKKTFQTITYLHDRLSAVGRKPAEPMREHVAAAGEISIPKTVMAGLDPAIHGEAWADVEMDGRLKGGHDD
jgi:hypothetical protein